MHAHTFRIWTLARIWQSRQKVIQFFFFRCVCVKDILAEKLLYMSQGLLVYDMFRIFIFGSLTFVPCYFFFAITLLRSFSELAINRFEYLLYVLQTLYFICSLHQVKKYTLQWTLNNGTILVCIVTFNYIRLWLSAKRFSLSFSLFRPLSLSLLFSIILQLWNAIY